MKKILYFLYASLLVLSSCSNDDGPVSGDILIKKIVEISNNGTISTNIVKYYGNKIVSIYLDGGGKINYTYSGNLITEIKVVDKDENVYYKNIYNYSNGVLTNSLHDRTSHSAIVKIDYVYQSNEQLNGAGSVLLKRSSVNKVSGEENELGNSYLNFESGNLLISNSWGYELY